MSAVACSFGAEYFVSFEGDDRADGKSRKSAFATIQRGLDALGAGDTLTIGPGEYFGASAADGLGNAEVDTIIRAEIPGTVIIRGDAALPAFRKTEGLRNVYETEFAADSPVQGVIDQDALLFLSNTPNLPELEFRPGTFFHDRNNGRLYLAPHDFGPAEGRRYTATKLADPGIALKNPQRVRVEGLAVTGFRSTGLLLKGARGCVVAKCRAYLNHSGITVDSAGGNVIEDCEAWANSGDGISANQQDRDTIRNCRAFLNGGSGCRLYAGSNPSLMHDNLAWGNGSDFFMKSGVTRHLVERCAGPGHWPYESSGSNIRNCLLGLLDRGPQSGLDFVNNIQLLEIEKEEPGFDPEFEFADPANHDYRLQASSRFRGAGADGADLGAYPYQPNIFYVAPQGDDSADGLSAGKAWKSLARASSALQAGGTLYLLPGKYDERLVLRGGGGKAGVSIRGRGHEPVVLAGGLEARDFAHGLELRRLVFENPVGIASSNRVDIGQCVFRGAPSGIDLRGVRDARVVHCAFSGPGDTQMKIADCAEVFLSGNLFENTAGVALATDRAEALLYADFNAYARGKPAWRIGPDVLAIDELPPGIERHGGAAPSPEALALAGGPHGRRAGVYREDPGQRFRIAGPFVHAPGASSVNIEWVASSPADVVLAWGRTPECAEGRIVATERHGVPGENFGSVSITGLEPETAYYVKLAAVEPKGGPEYGLRELTDIEWSSQPLAFTTLKNDPDPTVYFVAPGGRDAADGRSPASAWRTLNKAMAEVRPGDTVFIAGGEYEECLRLRATGLPDRPITIRSVLGDRVVLSGGINRELAGLILGLDKSYYRIDGINLRNITKDNNVFYTGTIRWHGGEDIRLNRIFLDGRIGWPGPLFALTNCADFSIRNSAGINSMGGPIGAESPGMVMENCVLLRNRIGGMQGGFAERSADRAILRGNILTDCQANKIHQSIGPIEETPEMVAENNAFFLRPERRIQADKAMNMAEFEEQVLVDGGLVADPRFAGLRLEDADAWPKGFSADILVNPESEKAPVIADLMATNPEFLRRGIGLRPEDFSGYESGPLDTKELLALADSLPPPAGGFGEVYRTKLRALRDRAADNPSDDALRTQLIESFVQADDARQARRILEGLLEGAGEVAASSEAAREARALLDDGQATLEQARGAERRLRRAWRLMPDSINQVR